MRRAWRVQNETWERKLLPWRRVPPSTPVAKARVIIMCDTHTKHEMEDILTATLAQRGIKRKRTRLGWDIVCRTGDPTSVHDIVRAGAQSATSILLMLSEKDVDGETKVHPFVRADVYHDLDATADMVVHKAKRMIDEQGDRIFER